MAATSTPTSAAKGASLPEKVEILVVGAGPTGLGAASRLHMLGHEDWLLIDQAEEAGGLACTVTTPEGFLFDMGGHVIFSHFDYFDQLCDAGLGGGKEAWCSHERVSYVRCRDAWVPYPFQNNIGALPVEEQVTCLRGLVEASVAAAAAPTAKPRTFDEWIVRCLGKGIADVFMRPYNLKVWGCPTTEMQCRWLGERVAVADAATAVENAIRGREAAGWGPNATFRFPARGGTGAIWKGVAGLLPAGRVQTGLGVASLDLDGRRATLSDGREISYGKLISTMPLDTLTRLSGDAELAEAAKGLVYSSSHIIGFGLRGANPHGPRCWLYFPEDDAPFYRATIFSHYGPGNTPGEGAALPTLCAAGDVTPLLARPGRASAQSEAGETVTPEGGFHVPAADGDAAAGPYWSVMLEITESSHLPRPTGAVEASVGGRAVPAIALEALQGCINTGLVDSGAEVVSVFHTRLEHGYPTPSLGRDDALAVALPSLKRRGVWSRGRFGAWRYEVANQDHSVMQGVQAVDNILTGAPELTLEYPDIVNARGNKNKDIVFVLPEAKGE